MAWVNAWCVVFVSGAMTCVSERDTGPALYAERLEAVVKLSVAGSVGGSDVA
jgi:hypothetical protein